MTAVKIRSGGSWVESAITEKVWVSGAWVEFSPSTGEEAIAWPSPPAVTDGLDGSQAYSMGVRFEVLLTQDCVGVQWRVPDSVAAGVPGAEGFGISLWETVGGTRIGEALFVPVPTTLQRIPFAAPISLVPGEYIAAVYTRDYVFTTGGAAGYETPSGNVVSIGGRLVANNSGANASPIPSDTSTLIFHVSPLMAV